MDTCAANDIRYTTSVECNTQESITGMMKTEELITYQCAFGYYN